MRIQYPTVVVVLSLVATGAALGHGGQYIRPVPLGPMSPLTGLTPERAEKLRESWTRGSARGPTLARKDSRATDTSFARWWRFNGATLLAESIRPSPQDARTTGRVRVDWQPIDSLLADAMNAADPDLVDSAVLAQARAAPSDVEGAFQRAWPLVAHPHESIRRSAIISLGLLGGDHARPVLVSKLDTTQRADPITSGIAAVALGLLSDPSAIPELARLLERPASPDVHCGAVIGLGLFERDRERAVALLLEQLDRKLPEEVIAQVPIALGRLGPAAVAVVPRLRALAKDGRGAMRAGAIIALGSLASPDDESTLHELRTLAARATHRPHRHLALIAIGRVAARIRQQPSCDPTAAAEAREFLLRQTERSSSLMVPFAAIALAVSSRDVELDAAERDRILRAIRELLDTERNDEQRAAAAVALGMLRDDTSSASLRAMLDPKIGSSSAFAAAALGLLGDDLAKPRLRDLLERPTSAFDLREQSAIALAELDRALATKAAMRAFDRAETAHEASFLARVLGTIGDDTALPALIRFARDESRSPLERAFAIVGIGRLLERSRLPWNARLAAHGNLLEPCPLELALIDIY